MRILWFTWKDLKNPNAGGAEVVNEELAKRLVKDNHEVIFIVGGYKGCKKQEVVDGYKVIRLGNKYTVYWHAFRYYVNNLKGWADLVIDEVNTVPFFAKFYVKEPNMLFVHQLARQIWFYQSIFPINIIGYLLEPLYLWMLSNKKVITVSNSTKKDLQRFGFKDSNISIITEGIDIKPIKSLSSIKKYKDPTLLSLGAIRSMKRTKHQIKAFEIAKQSIPNLKLKVAGSANTKYGEQTLKMIKDSPYSSDIEYLGKVSTIQKIDLMQKCHIIIVTSVKEGWGLIVTEAASQGTPAIVYDVDGLRDSVSHDITGLVSGKKTPRFFAEHINYLVLNYDKYKKLRTQTWMCNKNFTFEKSYRGFKKIILLI